MKGGCDAAALVRPHLREMKPYTPILPFEVLSRQLGRAPEDIVKLDANENPYGPPPEVLEALGSMSFPEIYPDPACTQLREALAADCGVDPELLLVGCGADELIDLLMRVVLEPGDTVIDTPPTFTMYAFDADVNAAKVETVPRNEDFSVDVQGVKDAVARTNAKLVFLTSPNNPDGSVMSEEDILELLQLPCIVVLDEAYVEFGSSPSRISWVEEYSNLIVLRTFSKRAGLAGLRLGYGAFPASLAPFLWRAKQPYNVSVAAQVAGMAALSNPKYLKEVKDALVSERERMYAGLKQLDFLEPYPSEANFVLMSVKAPWTAKDLKDALAAEGVMVRHYDKAILSGYVRISVGKPEQTDKLLEVLGRITPP